jgi:catechol 2,3-dioxygenase-like lactoylglutathione lyase family enzyme
VSLQPACDAGLWRGGGVASAPPAAELRRQATASGTQRIGCTALVVATRNLRHLYLIMRIYGLDHIQMAIPPGSEDQARGFYIGVLGLSEVPKPAHLVSRGGVWLTGGTLNLHLGVEEDFRPALKAHPALLVEDLGDLIARCEDDGFSIRRDTPLDGYDRVYVADPFGNRIELMERLIGRAVSADFHGP